MRLSCPWSVASHLLLFIVSLSLSFNNFLMLCLGVLVFEFILFGIYWTSWMLYLLFNVLHKNFEPLFLQLSILPFFVSPFLLRLPLYVSWYVWWCLIDFWGWGCVPFLSFFFLLFLRLHDFNWPICKFTHFFSAFSNLQLISSRKFLNYCTFFNYRISISFFLLFLCLHWYPLFGETTFFEHV